MAVLLGSLYGFVYLYTTAKHDTTDNTVPFVVYCLSKAIKYKLSYFLFGMLWVN